MKHNITPYPEGAKVNPAGQVFQDGKYLGYVDKVQNWGNDYLARPENGLPNKFFSTKSGAALYILGQQPETRDVVLEPMSTETQIKAWTFKPTT